MKNIFFTFVFFISTYLSASDSAPQLIVQNRILAKVNNKTISVLDVTKQMEVSLSRQYPQYMNSPAAKYQYFSSQWRDTLLQIIDHELILADAEKLKIQITDADVRETIHEKFGPNVMASLDRIGISYEEAKQMIHSELIVQRMTWYKIHAKAFNSVNAQDIKKAYTLFCEKNPPEDIFQYRVLSVRGDNEQLAQEIANKAFALCKTSLTEIDHIPEILQSEIPENSSSQISIALSETYSLESKSIADSHKEALVKLSIQSISEPIKQLSKTNQGFVYRIFFLKDRVKKSTPALRAIYDKLQNELVHQAIEKESRTYLGKLRDRYGFDARSLDETIPSGFQPFILK